MVAAVGLLLLAVHAGHLWAVRNEGWGTNEARMSLAYVLLDQPMQRRFNANPSFVATELLLQERVPKTPSIYPHPAEVSAARSTPATSKPSGVSARSTISNTSPHAGVTLGQLISAVASAMGSIDILAA